MKISKLILGMCSTTVLTLACSSDPAGPQGDLDPAGDPTVESVIPSSGFRGTTLDIRVIGSGYDDGAQVLFEQDGTATEVIVTNSTQFVSSGELVANITIAEDAEPGAYDVVVLTTERKRGIGLEGFIVSVVTVGTLPGLTTGIANDVNDNGEVVGFGNRACPGDPCAPPAAFYWFGGVIEDLGPGSAREISGDCGVGSCRVVGSHAGQAVVWEKQDGVWTRLELPTQTGRGEASGINHRGDQIVGSMRLEGPPFGISVVWTETGGVWAVTELPTQGGSASAINDLGQVAGSAEGRAIVWTPEGTGWTVHELEPLPGDIQALANGINNAGDVVGTSVGSFDVFDERAVLWKKTPTGWSEPVDLLPPEIIGVTSSRTSDINDKGEIVGSFFDERLEFGVSQRGFLWAPGIGLVGDLGIFEGRETVASAINERNQIAGTGGDVALLWTFNIE